MLAALGAMAVAPACQSDRPRVRIFAQVGSSCAARSCADFQARCVRRVSYTVYQARSETCVDDHDCDAVQRNAGLRCLRGVCARPLDPRRCLEVSLNDNSETLCAVRQPGIFDTGFLPPEIRNGPFIIEVAAYGAGRTRGREPCSPGSQPLLFRGLSGIIPDITQERQITVPLACHLTCGDRYQVLSEDEPLQVLLLDVRNGQPMVFDETNPPPTSDDDIRFGDLFEGEDLADFDLREPDLSLVEKDSLVVYRTGSWFLPGGSDLQCRAFSVRRNDIDVASCVGRPGPNGRRYRARLLNAGSVEALALRLGLESGLVVGRVVGLDGREPVAGVQVSHDPSGVSPAYNLVVDKGTEKEPGTGDIQLDRVNPQGVVTREDGLFYFRGVGLGRVEVIGSDRCFTRPVVASLTNTIFVTEIRELEPDKTGACPPQ